VADNTVLNAMTGGDVCATDEITSGVAAGSKAQRIKNGFGGDGAYSDVASDNGLPISWASTAGELPTNQAGANTSAVTSVPAATSATSLLAANTARKQAAFYNDSTANLYLKLGASVTTTSFTVKLGAGGYYELPRSGYTGVVNGIWDAANGAARITELT
jgi:hypothetical protein